MRFREIAGTDQLYKLKEVKNMPIYRASDDGSIRKAVGGKAALGDGYYFGTSKQDVEGYGKIVKSYTISGKFFEVQGDKGIDQLKELAGKEGKSIMSKHLEDLAHGKQIDADLISTASSGMAYLPTFLVSKGISGLIYKNTNKDDHHDQVVVFDLTALK